MRFSQRIGRRPVKTALQVDTIDRDLLNRLWNTVLEEFFGHLSDYAKYGESNKRKALRLIWKEFFKSPIDKIPSFASGAIDPTDTIEAINGWFFKAEWFEVYDFIEFIGSVEIGDINNDFRTECNKVLKSEVAGYRFVDKNIVQITSEEEVREIEEALLASDKWNSVSIHLQSALDMLADRQTPDYRNSIKESISAVEAFCKIVTGDTKATLGKALNEIERKHQLHSALKTSFSALYGFTSDASGIRHALLEGEQQVEFSDAKFIFVSCSAFINFLKSKIDT